MKALEKLVQKNEIHSNAIKAERFSVAHLGLILFPLLFGILIDIGLIESGARFNLWLFGLGGLCFGLPLAAIGSLILEARWFRFFLHSVCQLWFVYFWAFQKQSWLAFAPLPVAYLILVLTAKTKSSTEDT